MKMLKDKKSRILLMGGLFASLGWGVSLAQAPATPAAAPVATVAAAEKPVAPGSAADWKPAQPGQDAKIGNWTLVDPGSLNVNLKIKKISVGDAHDVWAVGEDGKIYQLTAKGWEARTLGIDVAAAEDETVIVINAKNEVLKRNKKGGWDTIPNVKLESVSVGNDDAIWGTFQGKVFHFDDGKWELVKNMMGQDAKGLTFFSVNDEEVVYAIDDKNNIYRRDLDRVDLVKKTADLRKKIVAEKKAKAASKKKKSRKTVSKKKKSKKIVSKKKRSKKAVSKKRVSKKHAKKGGSKKKASKSKVKKSKKAGSKKSKSKKGSKKVASKLHGKNAAAK